MASYFIGSNSPSSGFGGSGNFMTQLGEIGPVWQQTALQGLNTQNAFNTYADQQEVAPYQVQAIASNYGLQALQNTNDAELEAARQRDMYRRMSYGNTDVAAAQAANRGYSPNVGTHITALAPTQGQPTTPAVSGAFAATNPSLRNAGTLYNLQEPMPYALAQSLAPMPSFGIDYSSASAPLPNDYYSPLF